MTNSYTTSGDLTMPGKNAPVRQHYNPVMLLRNFCNSDGLIWVSNGIKVYPTNPNNAFVERHLYTRWDFTKAKTGAGHQAFLDSIEKSYEHEEQLSKLEAQAGRAVRHIIERARKGKPPQLSVKDRNSFKRFVIAMSRRTPESQTRVAAAKDPFDVFYEASKQVAQLNEYPLSPKEALRRDPEVQELKDMVMSNTNARFAAGDHPVLKSATRRFMRETGLCVAAIHIPGHRFIIGSHGLAIIDDHVEDGLPHGSWLPIAHDVAVGVSAFPDRDSLIVLDNSNNGQQFISAINMAMAARSKVIAGPSESLVRSIIQT